MVFKKGNKVNIGRIGFWKGKKRPEHSAFLKEHPPWNKGMCLSKELKERISKTKKNNPTRYWLGKKRSEDTKNKISKNRIGKCTGTANPSWNGGITPINVTIRNSIEGKLWRLAVFERDKFTCQDCGQVGRKLNAHHIKPFIKYPELRFDVKNGITLCVKCHWNYHKRKCHE